MASSRNSQFQKRAGTFNCSHCTRLTRHTGVQDIGSRMCPQCYEASMYENSINDGGDEAEYEPLIDALYEEAVKLGGQIPGYPKVHAAL